MFGKPLIDEFLPDLAEDFIREQPEKSAVLYERYKNESPTMKKIRDDFEKCTTYRRPTFVRFVASCMLTKWWKDFARGEERQ